MKNLTVNGHALDVLDPKRIAWAGQSIQPNDRAQRGPVGIAEPAMLLQLPAPADIRTNEAVPTPVMSTEKTAAATKADRAASKAVADVRDLLSDVGTAVVAGTAGFSSWAGWVSLAESVGWSSVGPVDLAWLLPVSVDVYAFVALRTWNNARLSPETRRVGKWSAIGALALSIGGNAAGHAVQAGVFAPSWPIVVLVAALAPILLFLTLHLRVLRTRDATDAARKARDRAEKQTDRELARSDRSDSSSSRTAKSDHDQSSPDRSSRPARQADQSSAAQISRKSRPAIQATATGVQPTADQSARPVGKDEDARLVEKVLQLDAAHRNGRIGRDAVAKALQVGTPKADRIRKLADARKSSAPRTGREAP